MAQTALTMWNHRSRLALATIALPMLATACDEAELRRARIEDYPDSIAVTLPAAFQVGVADSVVVYSFGNSCVRFGRTDVTVDRLFATIEPFDIVQGELCADIGLTFAHRVELMFETAGVARLRFIGLDRRHILLTVDRTVPVN